MKQFWRLLDLTPPPLPGKKGRFWHRFFVELFFVFFFFNPHPLSQNNIVGV